MNIATWASEVNRKKLPSGAGGVVLNFFPSYFATYLALSIVVDFMVNEVSEMLQEVEDEELERELERRKEQGRESMKWFLDRSRKNTSRLEDRARELHYKYVDIGTKTLTKLISKKLKNFDELSSYFHQIDEDRLIHGVVFRQIWSEEYQQVNTYIHCVFINNKILI